MKAGFANISGMSGLSRMFEGMSGLLRISEGMSGISRILGRMSGLSRITGILGIAGMASLAVFAEVPAGYYAGLEGKSGAELKAAVKTAAQPNGFAVVSYGTDTWSAFTKTDVRLIGEDLVWRDMYSNRMIYVNAGHDGMNIEHSVANSWWGGKNGSRDAYSDLFHLNPSDADANNKKSNNPLGEVSDARIYDNGLVKIGTPASGFGGGATSVFEPADEYKGDFARAYLYVFTTYSDIPWVADKDGKYMLNISANGAVPQTWVVDMLLRWSAEDPVDNTELARNEEIYKIQKNRNPFIDYPVLAEYLYGSKQGDAFIAAGNEVQPVDRPAEPKLSGLWLTGVNTYLSLINISEPT
ncbi:MAG: endonuclease, partial [Muribaculaceae bacterium]|nr:endonuclease [Muribaculaceae bacterium]